MVEAISTNAAAATSKAEPATEKSIEDQAREMIEELARLDRSYFAKDRLKKIKEQLKAVEVLLDQKDIEITKNKQEKAELLYLRGRAMDFLPEYTKQAEDMLSKALKLQPQKREAWDALGHVYWKKNDLAASKKCFESSLEQDENNKEVLRNLSMVCRQQQEKDEKVRKANYKLSISLATKACGIDMKDSQSWYVLGNAHLTNFFVNNENISELDKALKAYAQTERTLKEPNPDLHFNRATVLEYLERYAEAVQDYNLAHSIDANLQADQKSGKIINFVVNTSTLITSRGKSQQKRLLDMIKSIPTTLSGEMRFPQAEELKTTTVYRIASIGDLINGVNNGAILAAKIVQILERPTEVPISFLSVDSKGVYFVSSFYHASQDLKQKLQPGDLLNIKNPQLIFTSLKFKDTLYGYQSVKLSELQDVLVNSQPIIESTATELAVTNTFA